MSNNRIGPYVYDDLCAGLQRTIDHFQAKTQLRVSNVEVLDMGYSNGTPCQAIVKISTESQPIAQTVLQQRRETLRTIFLRLVNDAKLFISSGVADQVDSAMNELQKAAVDEHITTTLRKELDAKYAKTAADYIVRTPEQTAFEEYCQTGYGLHLDWSTTTNNYWYPKTAEAWAIWQAAHKYPTET
jgi:hypothetical protein